MNKIQAIVTPQKKLNKAQSRAKKDLLNLARREVGVSKHFNLSHLNSPSIFEDRRGQVGLIIKLDGMPFETCLNEDLNYIKRSWHQGLCMIPEHCHLLVSVMRREVNIKLEGEFSDGFLKILDQEYQHQFAHKKLYKNQIYLTLVHRGLSEKLGGNLLDLNFFKLFAREALSNTREKFRQESICQLEKTAHQLLSSLSKFKPKLLGLEDEVLGYSELLQALSLPINGLEDFEYPRINYFKNFKNKNNFKYPECDLGSYLSRKRLFFGEAIQFQGADKKTSFGKILSIKEYGSETASVMLDPLLNLDCEFLQTHSFYLEPQEKVQKLINRQKVKLENSNDPARSQINELGQLQDDLASGKIKTGFYHHTLLLIAPDLEKLDQAITEAVKKYSQAGLAVVEETLGLEPAFWAQMPTNASYIVRAQPITSANFVDFCPLHNYSIGYRDRNHLGGAVTLIETPSRTPLFFNYHAKGSGDPNDLTPGHTTIIGGNGSGKTVFLSFMDAQMSRYGGQSFFFDRDQGLEIYVRACGGSYLFIRPPESSSGSNFGSGSGSKNNLALNPFSLNNTEENKLFLKNWLSELVKQEGELNIPSFISNLLGQCVDYAYEHLLPSQRYLSTTVKLLPIDFPRWPELHRWMQGEGIRNAGEYAYLFDHPEDALSLNLAKTGFDLTLLIDQPKSVLTTVMMYLFRRIEEVLNGQRVSIILDEGWMYLDSPYWQDKLKQWLPTLRKKNCQVILATQSPESIVNSPISSVFFDNCASNIFFCNEKANFERHYQFFNISESEFEFLKNTPKEKRFFLYKQSQESSIGRLNLNLNKDLLAVLSGNSKTVKLLYEIIQEVGEDPEVWLPIFHARRKLMGEQHG